MWKMCKTVKISMQICANKRKYVQKTYYEIFIGHEYSLFDQSALFLQKTDIVSVKFQDMVFALKSGEDGRRIAFSQLLHGQI